MRDGSLSAARLGQKRKPMLASMANARGAQDLHCWSPYPKARLRNFLVSSICGASKICEGGPFSMSWP